jgi:hypothetical protein
MDSTALNIGFRRTLSGNKWDKWIHLLWRLILVQLTDVDDVFRWKLTTSVYFSVKSMYHDLLNDQPVYLRKYIWNMKVPLKIKIFMWFLHKKVILTKENLHKRNWQGCTTCCFCDQEETIQHLFISCPFAKMIWRIVFMTFNIPPPFNITNMFENWLKGVAKKTNDTLELVCALFFGRYGRLGMTLCLTGKVSHHFLQVIPMATHWIHMCSYL